MTPKQTDTYDVLVIGGGAAGENAADVAARRGLEVALVEHSLLGGECTYWACMPSKALLRPGDALDALRRVPGVAGRDEGIDVAAALERRDALAANWDDSGQVEWLEGAGVDLIRGHGRFVGERRINVTGEDSITSYEARRAVVVATGSKPWFPPIDGLDEVEVWDSSDATSAQDVPRRLLVIGGGVVGVEMSQAWKWLGAEEVTLLHHRERLIDGEEAFVGEELRSGLEKTGVIVHTDATTEKLRHSSGDGRIVATVRLGDDTTAEIEADQVLMATGRRPNTSDLGAESVGLEPGEAIDVDDHLRATSVEGGWLYAVGDVNGRHPLTHSGKYQARIAGGHIAGADTSAWGDQMAPPRVIFTSPTVAAVGLTESRAREDGIEVRTVEHDIGKIAGASTLGRGYHGTCKLVVDAAKGTIVGATFVGPHTGDLIHAATIAIVGEVPLQKLWHAIPSFPTLSEVWLRLLESYRDRFDEVFR